MSEHFEQWKRCAEKLEELEQHIMSFLPPYLESEQEELVIACACHQDLSGRLWLLEQEFDYEDYLLLDEYLEEQRIAENQKSYLQQRYNTERPATIYDYWA